VAAEVLIDKTSLVVLVAAIAVEDTSKAAPKIAGLTTRDFHKILDIFLFILTPYVAKCLKMRSLVETCVIGMAATNTTIVAFVRLTID
jgi:hypothetical protein